MRTQTTAQLIGLLIASLTCGDALAQERGGPPEGGPPERGGQERGGQQRGPGGRRGRRAPDPLTTAIDADQNQVISAEEIAKAAEALIGLDKNSDGNITKDELAPPNQGGRRRGGRGGASPLLGALDLDRDGELFEDEVTGAAARLITLDANSDGELAGEEIRPQRGGFGGPPGGRRGGPPGGGPGGDRGGPPGGEPGGEGAAASVPEPSDLEFEDGVAGIPDREMFRKLSYQGPEVMIDTSLAGLEFVKFTVTDPDGETPKVYFINTETHRAHPMFAGAVGLPSGRGGDISQLRGVLTYRPMQADPSGSPGIYTFEFNPGDVYAYEKNKRTHDLLCSLAPVLDGKLAFYPLPAAKPRYEEEKSLYAEGNLAVYSPEDALSDIGFLPLHHAVSFGRLRVMNVGDRPNIRDIVLCPTLPNEMPRVAGILTGVRQTPLSHVNLRAIQDDVPNAYVRGAESLPQILALMDKTVRYEVTADGYELREATAAEVDAHFIALRPETTQVPERDLSVTEIRALQDVGFEDWRSVGVKAANVATLAKIGLPDNMVPTGFAVPFSFYHGFMEHNGFYEAAAEMMKTEGFATDASAREKALSKFRKAIKKGKLPANMRAALTEAQSKSTEHPIRARSSTNNEDLPGFSGAGLYDSFTHREDEGHLEKSILQVYSSLWNFRAFEEREFHRIDHMQTAMGVLLHRNFDDEVTNGVAVTEDIVYQTAIQGPLLYYVNAQVGENLVTNPEANAIPEEILLAPRNPANDKLVQSSSLVKTGKKILTDDQRMALRRALRVVHAEFQALYSPAADAPFSMEIEFKVLPDGSLVVKQARPWVY